MNTTANEVTPANQSTNTPAKTKPKIQVGKFTGSFGSFMLNVFYALKVYGFELRNAHLIALDFGNDVARAMTVDAKLAASVDKAKKDGESKFKFSGKSDSIKMTYAMEIVRLTQLLDKAYDEKIVTEYVFPPVKALKPELQSYLDVIEERAEETEWTD